MLHRRAYTCLIDIWNYICNIYISRYSYIYCNSSRYQVSLYHDKLTEQKVVEHGAGPSDQIHWNSWFVIRCNSGVRAGQQECCISWTCWIRRENSNVDDVKAKEVELFCLSGEKKKEREKKDSWFVKVGGRFKMSAKQSDEPNSTVPIIFLLVTYLGLYYFHLRTTLCSSNRRQFYPWKHRNYWKSLHFCPFPRGKWSLADCADGHSWIVRIVSARTK